MENPSFTGPRKLLQDLIIFNCRIPKEGLLQAGKLQIFGTRPNWVVSYIAYKKIPLALARFPRLAKFSLALASRRALVSQPVLSFFYRTGGPAQ